MAASATFRWATRADSISAVPMRWPDTFSIIHPASDPVIAIFIAARAVTGKISPFKSRKIGIDKALMIAIDTAHLACQERLMHKFPSPAPSIILFSPSTRTGSMPKKGNVAEPGLVVVAPGRGVINMPPVSVCHQVSTIGQRASPTLHDTTSGFGINWLTHRPQQA